MRSGQLSRATWDPRLRLQQRLCCSPRMDKLCRRSRNIEFQFPERHPCLRFVSVFGTAYVHRPLRFRFVCGCHKGLELRMRMDFANYILIECMYSYIHSAIVVLRIKYIFNATVDCCLVYIVASLCTFAVDSNWTYVVK